MNLIDINQRSKYNFDNDDFYLLLSYPNKSQDIEPIITPPSLSSILIAKNSWKLDINISVMSDSDESELSWDESSINSSNLEIVSLNFDNKKLGRLNTSILLENCDHPLSIIEDTDDDYYCETKQITVKDDSMFTKISNKFKKLSELAISISQSHLKTQLNSKISSMDFNERIMDEKLPNFQSSVFDDNFSTETELINLSKVELPQDEFVKQRESRINSKFLRIYAHDFNNKCNGFLPFNDDELDFYLNKFNSINDLNFKKNLKLSLLLREKLWSNVVLKLRNDEIKSLINDSLLKFIKQDNEIKIRGRCKERVIVGVEDVFGVVKVGLKVKYQYMKKGYIDQRWIS